jgi:hypothetical protein
VDQHLRLGNYLKSQKHPGLKLKSLENKRKYLSKKISDSIIGVLVVCNKMIQGIITVISQASLQAHSRANARTSARACKHTHTR